MSCQRKKNKENIIVYSTDPDFVYFQEQEQEPQTLEKEKQNLKIFLDKKQRAGKKVTIISNFIGKQDDLVDLSKVLKTKCSVGGSVKEGEIILQGDFREKVFEILTNLGYRAKLIK
ncbi:MAG: translation initiation factor [Bacteroidota bacterium]|nr:translation initiation factor [Bacteroidota bacterium]